MTIRFDNKVAIVTGAGGGLGRQHALEFARRGAKVVVNDLGGALDGSGGASDAANAVVEEIKAEGGDAIANGSSVSDRPGVAKMVAETMEKWGRIDILVNNAGILRDKSFHKMTLEEWDMVLDVHLQGSVNTTHAVYPIMREQGYGRIIHTSSSSGLFGNFGQANYSAAKMGLIGLMNTLKIEGQKNNVYSSAILPVAYTRMTKNLLPEEGVGERRHPHVPIIAFPREAGDHYVGFAKATGADCVAIDNSVTPEWAAIHVQKDGCVQGNLAPQHMVTGGTELIKATKSVVQAFQNGPHIFNLGHGITPDANPDNVQIMIDTVRG